MADGAGTSAQNVSQAGVGGSFCLGNPRTEASRCIPSEVAFQSLRVCGEKICNTLAYPHIAANTHLHICTLLTLNALITYNVFSFFFLDETCRHSYHLAVCFAFTLVFKPPVSNFNRSSYGRFVVTFLLWRLTIKRNQNHYTISSHSPLVSLEYHLNNIILAFFAIILQTL